MAARVPVKGSLSFLDSRGTPARDGDRRRPGAVDEGAAQPHRGGDPGRRRSGASASSPTRSRRPAGRSCSTAGSRSTTSSRAGTIEGLLNQIYRAPGARSPPPSSEQGAARPARQPRSPSSTRASRGTRPSSSGSTPSTRPSRSRPTTSRPRPPRPRRPARPTEAESLRAQAAALHSARSRRDDLQRLPDDQGQDRRAGLRRDRR